MQRYTIPDFGPSDLLTSERFGTRRVRVDVAQTGFFEGREFYTFQEFTIPSLGEIAIRAVTPIDVILFESGLSVENGTVRVELYNGGSAGDTWTSMPILPKNGMSTSPTYIPQVEMAYNGAHTGGQLVDLMIVASAGTQNKQVTAGGQMGSERGFPAGTYYYVLTNTSNQNALCVFSAWWEERP
jgi:hypothetical protein